MACDQSVSSSGDALIQGKLDVHLLHEPSKPALAHLTECLDPKVKLTFGGDLPEPAAFNILVAGRPHQAHLLASPRLTTLIIPFAGLPDVTRRLLLEHPHIAVHSLHHNAAIVAEMALGLLIAVSRRLVFADQRLRANDWTPRWTAERPKQLRGQNALVLGYGALGREMARLLQAIGMEVSAISRSGQAVGPASKIKVYPVTELQDRLPTTHALMVCLPGTPTTGGLIGPDELALLPKGALLVNVGRGTVVEEQALFEALRDGHLGGAGLDVWNSYPTTRIPVLTRRRQSIPSESWTTSC